MTDDMSSFDKPNWTAERPTEPGNYWFYGWLDSDPDCEREYYHVSVIGRINRRTGERYMMYFLNDDQIVDLGTGYWLKFDLPSPPEVAYG